MYYLKNRYYDPQTGRFITEDTHWNNENMIYGDNSSSVPDLKAIIQSTNLYAYCINNPVKYTDPTGRVLPGDKEEFGEDSITYRSLVQLGKMWEVKPQYRADIEALANKVREITRNFGARAIIDIASRMAPNSANDTDIVIAVGTNFVYSNNAQQVATQYAKNNFPQTSPDGNQNNAFKHTMWNALMSKDIGLVQAKLIGDAHEFGAVENLSESAEQAALMDMDLYNNRKGRELGQNFRAGFAQHYLTELAKKIKDMVLNGELSVVN